MEVIKNATYEILDNILIVTLPDGIQDNSQYEIRVKGLQSTDGKSQLDLNYRCVTALSPSYCNVSDVAILQDTFGIPENTILYYIRSASKYVDFIRESISTTGTATTTVTEITVPIHNFVITKVMLDCLLNAFINKAAGAGIKGTLGKISFENTEKYASNIDDLIDALKAQLKMWEYAIRGYTLEGRAAPVWAKKAYKTQNPTKFSDLINDINREPPTPV